MGTIGNNFRREAQELRDAFLTRGELEYFQELMKDPHERAFQEHLRLCDVKYLMSQAKEYISKIERGLVKEEDLEMVELMIVQHLSAIIDAEKVRDLEKIKEDDDASLGK